MGTILPISMGNAASISPQTLSSFLTFGNLQISFIREKLVWILFNYSRFQGRNPPSNSKTTKGDNEDEVLLTVSHCLKDPARRPTEAGCGHMVTKQMAKGDY